MTTLPSPAAIGRPALRALLCGTALSASAFAAQPATAQEEDVLELAPIIVRDKLQYAGAVDSYLAPASETGVKSGVPLAEVVPVRAGSSSWERAPAGGLLRTYKTTGEMVEEGDVLGVVSDPFGEHEEELQAGQAGLIIGRANMPIVNEGDALFHIARVATPVEAESRIESLHAQLEDAAMFDEDEII